jgi:hypothetical protein
MIQNPSGVAVGYGINILEELTKSYVEYYTIPYLVSQYFN